MWSEVGETIVQEFSDLGNTADITRVCVRLSVVVIL